MHDLLEKTHRNAEPDPAFEQRMVSGVRRKIQHDQQPESAWESVLVLWKALTKPRRFGLVGAAVVVGGIAVLSTIIVMSSGSVLRSAKKPNALANGLAYAGMPADAPQLQKEINLASANSDKDGEDLNESAQAIAQKKPRTYSGTGGMSGGPQMASTVMDKIKAMDAMRDEDGQQKQQFTASKTVVTANTFTGDTTIAGGTLAIATTPAPTTLNVPTSSAALPGARGFAPEDIDSMSPPVNRNGYAGAAATKSARMMAASAPSATMAPEAPSMSADGIPRAPSAPAAAATPDASRKLIRNAQLELEVKGYQAALDQIGALTKAAGGYVDTSNSQRGGNGKLQGNVVVKVLPQNLDDFLLKLRGLGEVKNQSVSTDDVTKDYFDTQARLENSRRMETQLQELLKHENSKVSDLLQVERELGRVRGEIEQMQGQLKLYDFQVQYATVTMQVSEKDLNQAAAYLLREQDNFSLFATDVEGTFQKARQTAEDFKAQVLTANLNHNSGSDVSAELSVMVAPDQIEPFLAQVRSLGRVANFTRQTQRVAKDGGESDHPADQTLTEKDKVQVQLSIRSDDESRKQVALTVVTPAVDEALDKAKAAALANAGTEILSSSLNKTPQGQSTAQLTLRVPGKDYHALLDTFRALGRTASFNLQRDDNSGPGANGDDAPVIISLALTDDDTPIQGTEMSVVTSGVDAQAQEIKKNAAAAGVEVKASSFSRQPDGTESAEMTFRLPMAKYPAFVESLKKIGKVESLTVQRNDRPDQARGDDSAPAEINLHLHNQREIVADNSGLWVTLRQTFGDGAGALFSSVRMIGVLVAFSAPWVFVIALAAWVGRRIYVSRRK